MVDNSLTLDEIASDTHIKASFARTTVGIESVKDAGEAGKLTLAVSGRDVIISGLEEGAPVRIYTPDGCMVYAGTESCVGLGRPGVYILRSGREARRFVVR